MENKIHVIGLAVQQDARLSPGAEHALEASRTIVGSERQLQTLKLQFPELLTTEKSLLQLPKLAELKTLIENEMRSNLLSECDPRDITVLASGDPMFFGIGRWLGRCFGQDRLNVIPAVSSVQAVCSELGLSLQDCEVASLHGRDIVNLVRLLKQNQTLILLTDQNSNPVNIAILCCENNFADAQITVCEDLGTESQRYRRFAAHELKGETGLPFSDLLVCVVEPGRSHSAIEFPGIDDNAFVTDGEPGQGMFTKREVRLVIASLLQPSNDDVIWDVGAGCGGVSTELAYWNRRVNVYAIEQNSTRFECLRENRRCKGVVDNLHIVDGRAPEALSDLPLPNKIFIGGNDGVLNELLAHCWDLLPDWGCIVASSVTQNTFDTLSDFALSNFGNQDSEWVESLQIAVTKGELNSGGFVYKAKLPVTLFKFIKPA